MILEFICAKIEWTRKNIITRKDYSPNITCQTAAVTMCCLNDCMLCIQNTSEASPQTTTHQAPYDGQKTSQNLIDGFREFRHDHRSPDLEIFEGKLKAENYRERFHQLLCREEDEHKRLLEEM